MDAIARDLTYRALKPMGSDRSVWFSAHAYDTDAYFGASLWESIRGLTSVRFGSPSSRITRHAGAWDDARTTSLAEISGEVDPDRAFSLLSLMGNAMEGIVLDTAGVHGTAAFLAELRRRHAGRSFTVGDFLTVAEQAQAGLGEIVDEWMHQTGLPGFLASPAEIVRLEDDKAGQSRYQVTVHVYNGEPVDGWLQLARYDMWGEGEPIRVPGNSAVEIVRIYDAAPNQLWLIPYLSLNRREIRLGLADTKRGFSPDRGDFVGSRPSNWVPPKVDGIVVDDLDAGFTWRSAPARTARWSLIDRFGSWPNALDHGLSVRAREVGSWVRRSVRSGWGKYRRTVAWAEAGDGDHQVFFTAQLAPGRWRLDYYLPERRIPERCAGDGERLMYPSLGSMKMKLIALENVDAVSATSPLPVREWTFDFDAALGETGWNKLGEYDLPGGEARLEVSNITNGEVVIADAIGGAEWTEPQPLPLRGGSRTRKEQRVVGDGPRSRCPATARSAVAGRGVLGRWGLGPDGECAPCGRVRAVWRRCPVPFVQGADNVLVRATTRVAPTDSSRNSTGFGPWKSPPTCGAVT